MVLFRNCALLAVALFIGLSTPNLTQAAPSITIEQTGNIIGKELSGVAGIELAIGYDTAQLSTPVVTKGSLIAKAMFVANASSPGTIKIAILSLPPFSGSGQLASITFGSNPAKGGIKSIVVSSMIDSKGTQIPVQFSVAASASEPAATPPESPLPALIATPGVPFSTTATESNSSPLQTTVAQSVPAVDTPTAASEKAATTTATVQTSQQPSAATTAPQKSPGRTVVNTVMFGAESREERQEPKTSDSVVTMPEDQPPMQTNERISVPANRPPAPSDKEEDQTEKSGHTVVFKSIAERFKSYRGDKSLPIMTALFRMEPSKSIRQEPPVALSDGKTGVRILIDLPVGSTSSPNFALENAVFLSVTKDHKVSGRWIIMAMPDPNTWKAVLNMIVGADSYEYPLTVAPPVGASIKTDQPGWDLFIKRTGAHKNMSYDFNRDGLLDYIDEFIFIANHLAGR